MAQELRINSEEAQGKRQERLGKLVRTESVASPEWVAELADPNRGSDTEEESSSDESKEPIAVSQPNKTFLPLSINRRPKDQTPDPPSAFHGQGDDEKQQMDGVSLLELPSAKGRVDRVCRRGHKLDDAWVHFGRTTRCNGPGKMGKGCTKLRGIHMKTPKFLVERCLEKYASAKSRGPSQKQMKYYDEMFSLTKVDWPLHHAAIIGDVEGIRHAIRTQKIDPNTKRTTGEKAYGRTPMHFAVHFGQIKAVIELIRNGADAFPPPSSLNKTPWQQASAGCFEHDDITAFLIDFAKTVRGVDINASKAISSSKVESDEPKHSSSKPNIGDEYKESLSDGLWRECLICYQHDLQFCGHADETREQYAFCAECQTLNVNYAKRARADLEMQIISNRLGDPIKMKKASHLHALLQDIILTNDYIVCRGFTLLLIDVDDEPDLQILKKVSIILKDLESKSRSPQFWAAWGCDIQKLYAFHRGGKRFALVVMHDMTDKDDKAGPFHATTDKARATLQILYEKVRFNISQMHAEIGISVGAFAGDYIGKYCEDFTQWIKFAERAQQQVKDEKANAAKLFQMRQSASPAPEMRATANVTSTRNSRSRTAKGARTRFRRSFSPAPRAQETIYAPSLRVCDLQTKVKVSESKGTASGLLYFKSFTILDADAKKLLGVQILLQAQLEFYLSNFYLESDSQLQRIVMAAPMAGFLRLADVMSLPHIRDLCNKIKEQTRNRENPIKKALKRSTVLKCRQGAAQGRQLDVVERFSAEHEMWIGRTRDSTETPIIDDKDACSVTLRDGDDGKAEADIDAEEMRAMRAKNSKKQSRCVRVSSPESVMEELARTDQFKKFMKDNCTFAWEDEQSEDDLPAIDSAKLFSEKEQEDVSSWSTADVGAWLEELGFKHYVRKFAKLGIDGATLLQKDMPAMLESNFDGNHAKKIVKGIEALKKGRGASSENSKKEVTSEY